MNYKDMPNVCYHIAKYRQNVIVSLRMNEKTPENNECWLSALVYWAIVFCWIFSIGLQMDVVMLHL